MRHGLYEDPITHKFAVIPLSLNQIDDEKAAIPATLRWFETREEALLTLFDQDEDGCDNDSLH